MQLIAKVIYPFKIFQHNYIVYRVILMCDLLGIQKLPTVQNMEMQVSITIYVCPNNTVKTKS